MNALTECLAPTVAGWLDVQGPAAAPPIPVERLLLALLPVGITLMLLHAWSIGIRTSLWAVGRMFVQLLMLGYLLRYLFAVSSAWPVLLVLTGMLLVASWISLRVAAGARRRLFRLAVLAICVGGGSTLLIITQVVLQLDPWYQPDKVIPLAGMIFSNCMNALSLAAERFLSERASRTPAGPARQAAFEASLIPITNSLFAVGLVSIPGMMTGQVLAGADAQIAAQYQIMVMCMMFGSAGITTALFLKLISHRTTDESVPVAETED